MLWKWIMLDVQNQCYSVTNKIPDKYHSLNTAHCLTHHWQWCLNSNYWPGWWNVKFTDLKDIYINTVFINASDMYNATSNRFFGEVERSILELLRDNPYISTIHIFYKHVLCYTRQSLALTLILLMWSIGWAPNNASKWKTRCNLAFKGLMFIECKHNSVVAQI